MTVTLQELPGGGQQTVVTLGRMAELVRQGMTDATVRDVALSIVSGCRERDDRCQLARLRTWLKRRWVFQRDPHAVEWTTSPAKQLAIIRAQGMMRGDCDDAAVLGATLGAALGFAPRFVVLGWLGDRGPYSHVFTELQARGQWFDLDVTRPAVNFPASRAAVYPI